MVLGQMLLTSRKNSNDGMLKYRTIEDNEEISSASEGVSIKAVRVGNVKVKLVIDGKDKVKLLKNVGYAPKCRTDLVSLTEAQNIVVETLFKGGGSKTVAMYKGRTVMHGDSKETGISELTGMNTTSRERQNIEFSNRGEDEAMKLAHRRTCHTAVSALHKMHEASAVHGLDKVISSRNIGNICEYCVDGKVACMSYLRR